MKQAIKQKSSPAILIRLSDSMREELKNLAHDNHKSLSEFLRQSLAELLVKK